MRASELRPGKFFEFPDQCLRLQKVDYHRNNFVWYIDSKYKLWWCGGDLEVTPLNVHGWDDEPQSDKPSELQDMRALVKGRYYRTRFGVMECKSCDPLKAFDDDRIQSMGDVFEEVPTGPAGLYSYDNGKTWQPAPLQLRAGWRWLEVGEVIERGDEYRHFDKWMPVFDSPGEKVPSQLPETFCRKIAEVPPSVEPDKFSTTDGFRAAPLPNRTDSEGRDVTDLPGLWGEGDRIEMFAREMQEIESEPEQFKAGDYVTVVSQCVFRGKVGRIVEVVCGKHDSLSIRVDFGDEANWFGISELRRETPRAGDFVVPKDPRFYQWFKKGVAYRIRKTKDRWLAYFDDTDNCWDVDYFRRATNAEILANQIANISDDQLDRMIVDALKPDADGWIEWKGGKCPVNALDAVEVRLRRFGEHAGRAARWSWSWRPNHDGYDIVAYRLVQPAPITHWVEVVWR